MGFSQYTDCAIHYCKYCVHVSCYVYLCVSFPFLLDLGLGILVNRFLLQCRRQTSKHCSVVSVQEFFKTLTMPGNSTCKSKHIRW